MATIVLGFESKTIPIRHIPGPEGVRGRNSDNTLIKQKLNWVPSISLREGLNRTYAWIKTQIDNEKASGADVSIYAASKVVTNRTPDQQFN
jgi:GDP-D-mannose 3',5'-epimerase